jgi:hypothetical protein
MTFDKLADRCLLFIDERKSMIIELLKEAELELSRQCNLYEDTRMYDCDGSESYGLPTNYKQIIFLQHDGYKLYPVSEDDIRYGSDGEIDEGDPRGYFVRNNGFHLDQKPTSGKLRLSYYGTVENAQDTSTDPSPIIPNMYHRDLCNYAIAIASAKNDPMLYDKHWMLWQVNVNNIINQDADRELIHTIKREI